MNKEIKKAIIEEIAELMAKRFANHTIVDSDTLKEWALEQADMAIDEMVSQIAGEEERLSEEEKRRMIYVKKEYDEDGDHYILLRVEVTCCKSDMLFKQIAKDKYFDMQRLEKCGEQWNKNIEEAMKLK